MGVVTTRCTQVRAVENCRKAGLILEREKPSEVPLHYNAAMIHSFSPTQMYRTLCNYTPMYGMTLHMYLSILEGDLSDKRNTLVSDPGESTVEVGHVSSEHVICLLHGGMEIWDHGVT